MATRHEGLATRVPLAMTSHLMWELVDRFELVTDEEIDRGHWLAGAGGPS